MDTFEALRRVENMLENPESTDGLFREAERIMRYAPPWSVCEEMGDSIMVEFEALWIVMQELHTKQTVLSRLI